jgi:chromosome segregation ATPase
LNSSNSNKINDEEKNEELNLKVIVKNSENIEMVDVMCQANLANNYENNKTIQELNLKIKTLENEKETLISQLKENQKKYEEKFAKQNKDINNLSLLNNKLKKNLDKVNIQVSKLLNQVVSNNTIPASNSNSKKETKIEKEKALNSSNNKLKNNEENKDSNVEIKILNEKLKFKESLIKDSQQTIEFLKKENKKLKEDYDSITSDGKTINQNHKLIQEIKKKNNEIRELEKDYKNLISSKSETKQIEYYKNKVKDLQSQNEENKNKINNFKQMLEKYQKKEVENKNNLPVKSENHGKSPATLYAAASAEMSVRRSL